MIIDDSLSRLTTRMIVHDSLWQLFSAGFKMAAKRSSRGFGAASQIGVYIQNDNHDKEHIEDQNNKEKISSVESVNSQELEETPQKRIVSLNVYHQIHLPYIPPTNRFLVNKLPSSLVAINSYFYKFDSGDAFYAERAWNYNHGQKSWDKLHLLRFFTRAK